jgi:hypothetical protein
MSDLAVANLGIENYGIESSLTLRRSRVVHLSTILASFILRTFLVLYSGVLENLGKAFKLVYAKPLRWTA